MRIAEVIQAVATLSLMGFMFWFLVIFEPPPRKYTYIESNIGLIPYSQAYCDNGLVLNNDYLNILDKDGNPLTCTGYLKLTKEEFNNYSK